MKRDMDLIRSILLAIEESDASNLESAFEALDCSNEVFQYHLGLLIDAGLIRAHEVSHMTGTDYTPTGLTWEGHEFLDDVRDESVWNKTKEVVRSQSGTVSVAILQEVAKEVVKGLFRGMLGS